MIQRFRRRDRGGFDRRPDDVEVAALVAVAVAVAAFAEVASDLAGADFAGLSAVFPGDQNSSSGEVRVLDPDRPALRVGAGPGTAAPSLTVSLDGRATTELAHASAWAERVASSERLSATGALQDSGSGEVAQGIRAGCADDRAGHLRRAKSGPPRIAATVGLSDSLRPVALEQYLPLFSLLALVILFAAGSFVASQLLGPRRPTAAKEAPYECGIVPETEPAERFPVKFYVVAMAFIVLDVEIIFLYPFTVVLKELAAYGLVMMGVFLLVALVPFGYLLSTGAVEWGPVREVAERVGTRVLRAAGMPGRDGLDPQRVAEPVEEAA